MVHENEVRTGKSAGPRLCLWVAIAAAALTSLAQAQEVALSDAVSLTAAMHIRDSVVANLGTNAIKAYPALTSTQLTCIKAASVSPMMASYATAIAKALTKDELTRAQTFYNSPEGMSYVSKQLSTPPAALTATESAALNAFLATTAGQKLIQNKIYMTADLNAELAGHLMWIVKGC